MLESEESNERHYSCRRIRNTALSAYKSNIEAASADIRQTDDLLPVVNSYACGHKGYLATIARNMALDHMRKYKKEVLDSFTKEDDDDVVTEPVSSSDTEGEVIEDIAIKEAISKLNPKEQQIINMKVLSEMTFAEISETLKVPMGTVTWRYREAIKKLRRYGYEES